METSQVGMFFVSSLTGPKWLVIHFDFLQAQPLFILAYGLLMPIPFWKRSPATSDRILITNPCYTRGPITYSLCTLSVISILTKSSTNSARDWKVTFGSSHHKLTFLRSVCLHLVTLHPLPRIKHGNRNISSSQVAMHAPTQINLAYTNKQTASYLTVAYKDQCYWGVCHDTWHTRLKAPVLLAS